jgi:hypothetical protein
MKRSLFIPALLAATMPPVAASIPREPKPVKLPEPALGDPPATAKRKRYWPGTRDGYPGRKVNYKDGSIRDCILSSVSKKEINDMLVAAAARKGVSPGTYRKLKLAAEKRLKELETV